MRVALGVDQDLRAFHERFRHDPLIGRAVRGNPALRAPGRPDPFEALIWVICEQLIEFERAASIQRRLVAALGRRCPVTGMRDAPTADVLARQAPALLACDHRAEQARPTARCGRRIPEARRPRSHRQPIRPRDRGRGRRAIRAYEPWAGLAGVYALHSQGKKLAPAR
jgi:hypothetical protein